MLFQGAYTSKSQKKQQKKTPRCKQQTKVPITLKLEEDKTLQTHMCVCSPKDWRKKYLLYNLCLFQEVHSVQWGTSGGPQSKPGHRRLLSHQRTPFSSGKAESRCCPWHSNVEKPPPAHRLLVASELPQLAERRRSCRHLTAFRWL